MWVSVCGQVTRVTSCKLSGNWRYVLTCVLPIICLCGDLCVQFVLLCACTCLPSGGGAFHFFSVILAVLEIYHQKLLCYWLIPTPIVYIYTTGMAHFRTHVCTSPVPSRVMGLLFFKCRFPLPTAFCHCLINKCNHLTSSIHFFGGF